MKNAKYTQTGLFDVTKIDSDILLIPFNGNQDLKKAVLLNEISAAIFGHIGEGKTLFEIVDLLMEKYDVERAMLERDVCRCIEQFMSLRIIDLIEQIK